MSARRLGIAAAVGAVLVLVVVFAAARAGVRPNDAGPSGTLALRQLLVGSGMVVRDGAVPPSPPGTFVLLSDLRTPAQERSLLAWVRRGGRLVVTDPASAMATLLGIAPDGNVGGFAVSATLAPGCVSAETTGVVGVQADSGDAVFDPTAPPGAVGCFPASQGPFVIQIRRGAGTVLFVGGPSPFTNALLARSGNAMFALRSMGPGPVVFGPAALPTAAATRQSVWSALPPRARAFLFGLALAVVAFALMRARRLGKPSEERALSPIPAGELVRAAAGLYRRGHATAFAGRLLRDDFAAWIGRGMGVRGADPDRVAAMLTSDSTAATGRARELLLRPDPVSDDQVISYARDIEDTKRAMEGAAV